MKLIVTIVNRGGSEELMSAARAAGARGGTIVNARGTGTQEDETFFGICLSPEKEMLLIVADSGEVPVIFDVLKSQPAFNQCGAGIIFTLNIEEIFRN